jgi:peroxiredoxin Q/BCP
MLEAGSKAPPFKLAASDGGTIALKDLAGKKVVVYFYPKDATPGCTLEAQGFRDAHKELARRNAIVLGVSKDSIESHCRFRDRHRLNFQLLSDPDGTTIEKYGAWGEKNMYGKKMMGIIRSTVIIDEGGKVKRVFPKVKVDGHVADVIAALDEK